MDHLHAARALMGISLGFHIIYVAFGIGFPLLLFSAEAMAWKTGNELYRRTARSWTRTITVLFAIGAVSGTILSFELGLLWPVFMGFGGPMIGEPFWLEGFAFFIEAIFVAIYVYGENLLSKRALFLSTVPIVLSSMLSAVFVISANGWMNAPAGFRLVNGKAVDVRPFAAMNNSAWPHEALHGTLATCVAACFAIAGVYAYHLLKGRKTDQNRFALSLALGVGGILLPLMLLTGDLAAENVAHDQPAKLAAMEAVPETVNGAPLVVGGWLDYKTKTVRYGLQIPYLLSLLAYHDPHAKVRGLDAFPPGATPDANTVHPFFDLMVLSFFIMLAAALWFWITKWRKKVISGNRPLLFYIIFASPFGLLGQEFGWFVTEFGRQPWIARGVMTVGAGVTPNSIQWVLIMFVLVYLALTYGLLKLLLTPAQVKAGHFGPERLT